MPSRGDTEQLGQLPRHHPPQNPTVGASVTLVQPFGQGLHMADPYGYGLGPGAPVQYGTTRAAPAILATTPASSVEPGAPTSPAKKLRKDASLGGGRTRVAWDQ